MRLTDEQIGAELAELRATPKESFASRLDQRLAAGFPAEQRARKPARLLTPGRLVPILGSLATIAVVAVVIGSNKGVELDSRGGSGSAEFAAPSGSAAPSAGVQHDKGAAAAILEQTAPVPPTGTRPRNARAQVQEHTAQLGLATDPDELQSAADGVIDVTERYDGFVDSSDVRTGGGSRGRASFQLRIPTQHLQDALADLSDLGRVTLRNQGSDNVTGPYVDAGKAFKQARAKVDGLLDDLAGATSESERARIRQELVVARQQLATARIVLRNLKGRVALTPVSVEITAQGDGTWSIGDAADDAVDVLEAIAGALLIAVAVLIPLAALMALGWLGARELSRRLREAALDR